MDLNSFFIGTFLGVASTTFGVFIGAIAVIVYLKFIKKGDR